MFYTYILKSLSDQGYYIGSSGSIEQRLVYHNNGKVKSTKSRAPFKLVYHESFSTNTDARKRENHLKKNYRARKDLFDMIDFERL